MELATITLSDLLAILLSITALGGEPAEIRIDALFDSGSMDTLIVKKVDDAFVVYDEMNGKLVEVARIVPVEGKEGSFLCSGVETMVKGGKHEVNLKELIGDLDAFKSSLEDDSEATIATEDGLNVSVRRSGKVVYVIDRSPHRKCFYVAHAE